MPDNEKDVQRVEVRTISMYPAQWQKMERLATERFGANISLAMRSLVDSYVETNVGLLPRREKT